MQTADTFPARHSTAQEGDSLFASIPCPAMQRASTAFQSCAAGSRKSFLDVPRWPVLLTGTTSRRRISVTGQDRTACIVFADT